MLSWFYWITPCLRLCRWKCTSSVPSVRPRSRCVKLPNKPSRYLRWDRIWCLNCWGLYLRTLYRLRSLLKWCLCWSLLGPRTVILGPWWGFFHPWKTIPVIIRAIIKVLSLQPQNSTIFKHFVHDFSYWLNVFCLRIQVKGGNSPVSNIKCWSTLSRLPLLPTFAQKTTRLVFTNFTFYFYFYFLFLFFFITNYLIGFCYTSALLQWKNVSAAVAKSRVLFFFFSFFFFPICQWSTNLSSFHILSSKITEGSA